MSVIIHNLTLFIFLIFNLGSLGSNSSLTLRNVQDFAPYSQNIPNSEQSIDFVPVSGGTFDMGPSFGESETLRVKVDSFWIGKFEITWDQYDLFVKDNIDGIDLTQTSLSSGSTQADALSIPTPPYVDMSFGMGKDGSPAINMTNYAAIMFTKWLYAKTGIFYRLPTEAEWEYACKANHPNIAQLAENDMISSYAWSNDNSNRKYHNVGSIEPGELLIHDILGNVAEWTLDQYQPDYSSSFSEETVENPFLMPKELYPRTVRGGSWMDELQDQTCTRRIGSEERWQRRDPQLPKSLWWLTDAPFVGFRIVRPLKKPTDTEIKKYWVEAMEAF